MGLLYRLDICSRQLCPYPDAMVSIVIFLPELSVDLLEKAVKAGTEQKNWVERMKESLYVQITPRWWQEK